MHAAIDVEFGVRLSTAEFRMRAAQNDDMTNLATALKNENSRIARKEVRGDIAVLKKALGTHRSEIAALKRRAQALEQEVRRLGRVAAKDKPAALDHPATAKHRFSAKGLASQRQRLGLSAAECGLLVGASAQSIYNWEAGSARPREKHLAAIAAL
ncbi:MAG: helix-turn-helix transcriptional regulator [Burkholderiales bacterium]